MDCEHRVVEVTSAPVLGLRTTPTRHLFECLLCHLTAVVIEEEVVDRTRGPQTR